MSEPKTDSPRDALLARRITKPEAGCTPLPCPECPVPGVFVARLSGARYMEFLNAYKSFQSDTKDPAAQAVLRKHRLGVQLLYAAVDADGRPLLKTADEALALDAEVASPLVELFLEANGLLEKKSAPPSSPPAASP